MNFKINKLRLSLPVIALLATACGNNTNTIENLTEITQEEESIPNPVRIDSTIWSMELDDVKVTWIRDNAIRRNNDLKLFGEVPQNIVDSLGVAEGIPSSMSAVLIQKDSMTILCDAGLGMPESLLVPSLNKIGLNPEDIKLVYLTHLHPDHIGGMMANGEKVFPNAEVYIAKPEFDAWMGMTENNQMQTAFAKIYEENIKLFNFNDTLPACVIPMDAHGHTPGHTVFQAGKALIIGDLMHGMALQTAHPEFCASYDMNPEEAVKSRKKFLNYAKENKLTMVGMHLPEPGFYHTGIIYFIF